MIDAIVGFFAGILNFITEFFSLTQMGIARSIGVMAVAVGLSLKYSALREIYDDEHREDAVTLNGSLWRRFFPFVSRKGQLKRLHYQPPVTFDAQSTDIEEQVYDELDSAIETSKLTRVKQWIQRKMLYLAKKSGTIPSAVDVQAARLVDSDNEPIYVAYLNHGYYRLASRNQDDLAEAVEAYIEQMVIDGEQPKPTFEERYYGAETAKDSSDYVFGIAMGRVDFDNALDRLEGDCYSRVHRTMVENDEIERAKLVEKMVYEYRYPERTVEATIRDMRGQGNIRQFGDTLEYKGSYKAGRLTRLKEAVTRRFWA